MFEDPNFLNDQIPKLIEVVQQLYRETARLRSDANKLLVSVVGETDEPERDYMGPKIRTTKDLVCMLTSCRRSIVNSEYDITAIRSFLSRNGRLLTKEEINLSLEQARRQGEI